MAVNYGVSADGFKRKRLPEIISDVETRIADKLGRPIQTSANSMIGQLIGVLSYDIADLWEVAEETYNAMYPNTASGVNLSNAAGLAGISQIAAEKTSIIATCYGQSGTKIPYGANITDGTYSYACDETDAAISLNNASYAEITAAVVEAGKVYALTLDGENKTYAAKGNDTVTAVLNALISQFDSAAISSTLQNGVLTVETADQSKGITVACDGLIVSRVGTPIRFVCSTPGNISPAINTVNQIPVSAAGWERVSNNVAAVVGRDAETDTELRRRWSTSVYERGAGMVESISAAVYDCEGVTSATCYENTSDTADEDGRPPHSIEVVAEGGAPADIAKSIWQHKAAGIDTFGSVSEDVSDSMGVRHTIRFNRPIPVKVWLKVTVTGNGDTELSESAAIETNAAIMSYAEGLTVGNDVILQAIVSKIYSDVAGVGYITVEAATGDTAGTYTARNITIDARHVAVIDASRVQVVINE